MTQEEIREKERKCIWREFDHWCHCTQCLRHALKYESDVYDLGENSSPVGNHICHYCADCGFEEQVEGKRIDEQRHPIDKATDEEMKEYERENRLRYIKSTLEDMKKKITCLEAEISKL